MSEEKHSADLDESVFEDDRNWLYQGLTEHDAADPVWGKPEHDADKINAYDQTFSLNEEQEIVPHYRKIETIIGNGGEDTTPDNLFDDVLNSFSMEKKQEQAAEKAAADAVMRQAAQENSSSGADAANADTRQQGMLTEERKKAIAGKMNSEKSGYVVLGILGGVFLLTLVIVLLTNVFHIGASGNSGKSASAQEQISAETQDEEITETEKALTSEEETEATEAATTEAPTTAAAGETAPDGTVIPADALELPYCDNDMGYFPTSVSEFAQIDSEDGMYSFIYPITLFDYGFYDPDTEKYYLSSAEGEVVFTIEKEDPVVYGDAMGCAAAMLDSEIGAFVTTAETADRSASPYNFTSKKISDNGFTRTIVAGNLLADESMGQYILNVCGPDSMYILTVSYPAGATGGTSVEKTECGYMLDCIYRGFSLSGSSYQLRSYEDYVNGVTGEKKP